MDNARGFNGLDLTWVHPSLAIGGEFPAHQASRLITQFGIRRVIDLREIYGGVKEDHDHEAALRQWDIQLLSLPTPEESPIQLSSIWSGIQWIHEGLESDHRILLCSRRGVGRSVILGCSALVSLGYAPVDALWLIKDRRWQVSPTPAQLLGFFEWAERSG